jgi:hypothetical protein
LLEMFLLAHRFLRGTVLGLMCFLAGAASCSCDSYDPNPYDDIPPVVTVEFNYVIPSGVALRHPGTTIKYPPQTLSASYASRAISVSVPALASTIGSTTRQGTSRLLMSLRC